MLFLVLKILALLFAVAAAGYALGRYHGCRNCVDVTNEYTTVKTQLASANQLKTLEAGLQSLTAKVDGMNIPSLDPVHAKLGALESSVRGIKMPEPDFSGIAAQIEGVRNLVAGFKLPSLPPPPDQGPLLERLAKLEASISGIKLPATDLAPVQQRIDGVEKAIAAIRFPEAKAVDFAPLLDRLGKLEASVAASSTQIQNFKPAAPQIDLQPLASKLDAVEKRVSAINLGDIKFPESKTTDLAPVLDRLGRLESSLSQTATHITSFKAEGKPADFTPVFDRLGKLESAFTQVSTNIANFKPEHKPTDLSPVLDRLAKLETSMSMAKPGVDFGPLTERLTRLETSYAQTNTTLQAFNSKTTTVDLSPVVTRLAALEELAKRPAPAAATTPVDLGPVLARFTTLEQNIAQGQAQKPNGGNVDFGPILQRLANVESLAVTLNQKTGGRVDLEPTYARLDRLEKAVAAIRMPEKPDFGPLMGRLGQVEASVNRIGNLDAALSTLNTQTKSTSIDWTPMLNRLTALEAKMGSAPKTQATTKVVERVIERVVEPKSVDAAERGAGRNLLKRAAYGKPDDLKRIVGVGPVLEKMLHKIGVYYFWQVADWKATDVKQVDALLTAFKGRITRDQWVPQCRDLEKEPASAKPPYQN